MILKEESLSKQSTPCRCLLQPPLRVLRKQNPMFLLFFDVAAAAVAAADVVVVVVVAVVVVAVVAVVVAVVVAAAAEVATGASSLPFLVVGLPIAGVEFLLLFVLLRQQLPCLYLLQHPVVFLNA